MSLEARENELSRTLSVLGFDMARYTSALVLSFLNRFPEPMSWTTASAQSALISTFAIGETTFMRHPEQFAALRALLPDLCERRAPNHLRVLSAGCSSGEEAYSLAATLSAVCATHFDLFAWDVNPEAIARAKRAEYRPWSLRGVDADTTRAFLEPHPCGVRVQPWLMRRVSFDIKNLCLDALPPDLDVIFCRNVLLYFRPDTAQLVLLRLAQALRPGGVLFLGHYDPRPSHLSGLRPANIGQTLYYERAEGLAKLSDPESEFPKPRTSMTRLSLRPRADDASPKPNLKDGMQRVRQLANDHRAREALDLLARLQEGAPLMPDLHVLTALVAEEAGDLRLMLEASRRACFLVPEHPGPNYLLSVAFVRNGELRRAAVHRRIAAHALRSVQSPNTIVDFSEGLTAGQIRRLIGAIAR